jgi:DNA-binding Lrp family transcriptional regulator
METAYVLINCDLGSEIEVLDSLKHIDSVKEVHGTFGAYDIIVNIENPDKDKLREMIIYHIRKIQHVRSTLTLMGIPGQN